MLNGYVKDVKKVAPTKRVLCLNNPSVTTRVLHFLVEVPGTNLDTSHIPIIGTLLYHVQLFLLSL